MGVAVAVTLADKRRGDEDARDDPDHRPKLRRLERVLRFGR
jgi:hypothetical protein